MLYWKMKPFLKRWCFALCKITSVSRTCWKKYNTAWLGDTEMQFLFSSGLGTGSGKIMSLLQTHGQREVVLLQVSA